MNTLLLSVDFEDWHQLVRRRLDARDWQRTGPALDRQTHALLALLDELGLRATFFVLGMAARSYPALVNEIAAAGHEIACHGDQHLLVHSQTSADFAGDLRAARETIGQLTGVAPAGYRAPVFSINGASARWAYRVLADEGFAYDSSQYDLPQVRGRVVPASAGPHQLASAVNGTDVEAAMQAALSADPAAEQGTSTLWEFPLAVWRLGRLRIPVGGASYWSLLPTKGVLSALDGAPEMAGLYLHPYEFDPQPLRALPDRDAGASLRARASLREARYNGARHRAPAMLRTIAKTHRLITFGEAYAQLSAGVDARS
ncbi:MAG TPA: polysaccharide deacetylase family protein [Chloroflexota bacterium]